MELISKQLKAGRAKSGYSQRDISNIFGYTTPQFVSNWERGLIVPSMSTLIMLGDIYKINTKRMYMAYRMRKIKKAWDVTL